MFIPWTWLFIAVSLRSPNTFWICRIKLENFPPILSNATRARHNLLQFSSGTNWPCVLCRYRSDHAVEWIIWPNSGKLSTFLLTSVNSESKFSLTCFLFDHAQTKECKQSKLNFLIFMKFFGQILNFRSTIDKMTTVWFNKLMMIMYNLL